MPKTSTNSQTRIEAIADWLEKQSLDDTITDDTIWNDLKLTKSTYYRAKKQALLELARRQELRQNTISDTIVSETKEAAVNGLKSKLERVMFYQNEIDILIRQLRGNEKFSFKLGMIVGHSHDAEGNYKVPIEVQNQIREQIKSYQTEISKIEGDYATLKLAETDAKGNDKPMSAIDEFVNGLPVDKLFEYRARFLNK